MERHKSVKFRFRHITRSNKYLLEFDSTHQKLEVIDILDQLGIFPEEVASTELTFDSSILSGIPELEKHFKIQK